MSSPSPLTPDLAQRLQQILLALPQWELASKRHALVADILRGHAIWEQLDLTGSKAEAAARLIDLYNAHGPEPYLLLLSGLRKLRDDLAKEIDELTTLLRALRPPRPRHRWNHAPYPGLEYFSLNQAAIFFGRETEALDLHQLITQTEQGRRFCVVVGASGSGKSSLVRAGLWPILENERRWFVSVMKGLSYGDPFTSLRTSFIQACEEHHGFKSKDALSRWLETEPLNAFTERLLPDRNHRWLLILDQMEELFAKDTREQGALFLDRLLEATNTTDSRFQVLATLRSDFFHHCLDHPPLHRALTRDGGHFLLGAPSRLALERMVTGPLTENDLPEPWTLDPALAPTIATDAGRHSGGLALMAFALSELYELSKRKRRLDTQTYHSDNFGGLAGAIARRAGKTMNLLGEDAEATLERVFARLVRVSKDDEPTRRREPRASFDNNPAASKLITAFIDARLLVSDKGQVEVAHEALLREWPRLALWIDRCRDAFTLAERVRTEAHAWLNGPASRHHRRPWLDEEIEEYRQRLAQANLLDSLLNDPHAAILLMPEKQWLQRELTFEATIHHRRAAIGNRLAELGDDRPGFGLIDGLPDILWRAIPGGRSRT